MGCRDLDLFSCDIILPVYIPQYVFISFNFTFFFCFVLSL